MPLKYQIFHTAADIFAQAECTRYEGDRVKKQVNEKTLALQRISSERLKRRSKDIYYWMKELERLVIQVIFKSQLLA